MRKKPEVLSVLYVAQVHAKEKRFFVPKRVLRILNISPKGRIALSVRKASGEIVFCGEHNIVSGEVYGPQVSTLELEETIWVEASKSKSA